MTRRVAFYAPLKSPDHPVPSGDRRMARALVDALETGGHHVQLASRLRSYDRNGDGRRQERMRGLGLRIADRLVTRYRAMPPGRRPEAWVTYHAYHKSPDWLGPRITGALNIPYLLIETSLAGKQAGGPWDLGHRATEAAIQEAEVALAMTSVDEAGLAPLVKPPAALRRLPPFLDPGPFRQALGQRADHRRALGGRFGLDADRPWLLAVGMMRDDVKRQSYGLLAAALQQLLGHDWQLLVIGDGPARPMIEKLFDPLGSERVSLAGILDESELPACYVAADVYAWPAVREAYGMALLEAQASGLPVIAGREGGVADVVLDGVTGLLTEPRDPGSLAAALADLLRDRGRRQAMSAAAIAFVEEEHSLDRASTVLDQALSDAFSIAGIRSGRRRPDL